MSMLKNFKSIRILYSRGKSRLFTRHYMKNQSTTKAIPACYPLLAKHNCLQNSSFSTLRTSSSSNHFNISNVSNDESDAMLKIKWDDDTSCEFPHVYLRDNCQCKKCFHADAKTRQLYTVLKVDLDICAQSVSLEENKIKVTWPNGHASEYTSAWLRDHIFTDLKSNAMLGIEQEHWDNEQIQEVQPIIQYSDWIEKDEFALKNIEYLMRYGVCIIKNGPRDEDTGKQICKRIGHGYNKITHYGDTFSVRAKPTPNNLAFTSGSLQLHMDMVYLKYQADIQYLHCIEQSDGDNVGASKFSDGFLAAEKLRIEDKEAFDILSDTYLEFYDKGCDEYGEFHAAYNRSILEFDKMGKLEAVNYNVFLRSGRIYTPSHKIKDFYRAFYKLASLVNDKKHVYKVKLEPGDMVTFDNRRILHGRTKYDATKTRRWLQGGYLEWDSVCSKYRVLRKRVNNNK